MSGPVPRAGFVAAGSDTYWNQSLAEALSEFAPTLVLRNPTTRAWLKPRLRRQAAAAEPAQPANAAQWAERTVFLPSILRRPALKFLRPLGAAAVRRAVRRWARPAGIEPWLLLPYPWLRADYRCIPTHRTVYYNFDDYRLYDPRSAVEFAQREVELIAACRLTLCLSAAQAERFRDLVPSAAARICHFPLGTVERGLNRNVTPPRPGTVGYIGNLGDRIDWALVCETAAAVPEAEFEFVGGEIGRPAGGNVPRWRLERERARQLPNVRFTPFVKQELVHEKYREFAVSWMPYAADHAFNLAASPTKLMDTFAAARPLVSTDLPESRLYPDFVTIGRDAAEQAAAIRALLACPPEVAAARDRRILEFAARNTWRDRARQLHGWLTA